MIIQFGTAAVKEVKAAHIAVTGVAQFFLPLAVKIAEEKAFSCVVFGHDISVDVNHTGTASENRTDTVISDLVAGSYENGVIICPRRQDFVPGGLPASGLQP